MYVCGITPYDYCHLGHARAAIVFDFIRRYLIYSGYQVKYVTNLTDVDDKIINKARSLNQSASQVAERYIEEYFKDMENLGVKQADFYPRATGHIGEMIELIKILTEKKFAYVVEGNVFFEVEKFKPYGQLSKRSLEEMQAGARVEVNEKKKNPLDFALWKKTKLDEPNWESPWGRGRPGWHIECSTMSIKYLGETFDLHGGGQDLIFPHHENEIAQSEAATGKKFVNYWLHNGFVRIKGEKMSKSLGNFFTIREILKKYPKEVVRLFILGTHYRSPLDFSEGNLKEAQQAWQRYRNCLERMDFLKEEENDHQVEEEILARFRKNFHQSLDDDFNTAKATGVIFELVRALNIYLDRYQIEKGEGRLKFIRGGRRLLKEWGELLGIFPGGEEKVVNQPEIERLVKERERARQEKNYQLADEIREKLRKMGVILEDHPQGTRWKKR
jgi:cysteinyl-tRNA synthetase